jgi:LysM repeat protein
MFTKVKRSIAAAVTLLLVVISLTAMVGSPAQAEQNGKMFDPGLIISDSVFFDFGTMSVADIQRFLDSKVPICNANDGGPTCLRYYKQDTQAKAGETGRCTPLPAKTAQTAAQIIFDIAHACGINPRVLIVLLQKEQGLVQATNPTAYMYKAATGYGCPDSNPAICGKGSVITGLFNQLYRAAGQLQWYGDPASSFTYLKVGKTISMRYHPDSCAATNSSGNCTSWVNKCGNASFTLKSQATADLYYYTPYTPNAAALKNLYGSGDSCSAYGNRNFWRFYSDWFGSTIGGGFLLKSKTSGTYLIVDNKKYLIDEQGLVDSLSPLGPLGTISDAYLSSFTDSGKLSRLVKSSTGSLFLIDQGKKFTVANCDTATSLSLDCATAVALTANQLAAIPAGGTATSLVVDTDGSRYLIQDGMKRQILDDASVTAESIRLPAKSSLGLTAFGYLPWGPPVAKQGTIFTNKTDGRQGVYIGDQFFEIDPTFAKEVDFSTWFTKSAGTLTSAGLSQIYSNVTVGPFVESTLGTFLITATGKRQVSNPEQFVAAPPHVNSAFISSIASAGDPIAAPMLAKRANGSVALITGAQQRPVATRTDLSLLTASLGAPSTVLGANALAEITEGAAVFAPGSVLKSKKTGAIYLVDSYSRLVGFTSPGALQVLSLADARTVSDDAIMQNKIAKYSGLLVECNGVVKLPSNGYLTTVASASVSAWPGKPFHLGSDTCANYIDVGETVSNFVRDADTGAGFYIFGGQKHLITSNAIYKSLRGTKPGYVEADPALLAKIPTGTKAVAKPVVVPVTPGAKTYTVVAGDSLGAIASKLKTTVAILKSLNKLTTDNIRVGQVLVIP